MGQNLHVRQAQLADFPGLTVLLETTPNIHRHLDWRPALEWLGSEAFWILEDDSRILAALACPPDPPAVAWIRLFVVHPSINTAAAWNLLFAKARVFLRKTPHLRAAGIVLHPWFGDLLSSAEFSHHQDIVVLEWDNVLPAPVRNAPSISIRPIQPGELAQVARVDNTSFESLWQNSQDSLTLALKQAAYATVAEVDGQVIGYQISTGSGYSAHLARLAVLPRLQHKAIGYLLVRDLLEYFANREIYRITVNTQDNNSSSLALYQKMGFWLTGDQFQVLVYPK